MINTGIVNAINVLTVALAEVFALEYVMAGCTSVCDHSLLVAAVTYPPSRQ